MPKSILGRGNTRQNEDYQAKQQDRLQEMRQIHIVNTKHFQKIKPTASSHATLQPHSIGGLFSYSLTTTCGTSVPSNSHETGALGPLLYVKCFAKDRVWGAELITGNSSIVTVSLGNYYAAANCIIFLISYIKIYSGVRHTQLLVKHK